MRQFPSYVASSSHEKNIQAFALGLCPEQVYEGEGLGCFLTNEESSNLPLFKTSSSRGVWCAWLVAPKEGGLSS